MTINPFLVERMGLGIPATDITTAVTSALVGIAGLAPHRDGFNPVKSRRLTIPGQVASKILVNESAHGQPGQSDFFDNNPAATIEAIRNAIIA